MTKAKNLVGQKFGRLTVVSRNYEYQQKLYEEKGVYKAFWNCKCDCGNEVIIYGPLLLNGNTKSCGCYAKEKQKIQKNTKNIHWDIKDEITIGTTRAGDKFIIDTNMYEMVKDYCWRKDPNGYIVANSRDSTNKIIRIHRLIMDVMDKPNILIDHKNWDKSDNRKENLRYSTKSQNNINIKRKSNNTTGYTGVTRSKNNKYLARISFNGRRYNLGTYENIENAIKARHEAEKQLHGEWSGEHNRKDYKKFIKAPDMEEAQEVMTEQ